MLYWVLVKCGEKPFKTFLIAEGRKNADEQFDKVCGLYKSPEQTDRIEIRLSRPVMNWGRSVEVYNVEPETWQVERVQIFEKTI